MATNSLRTGGTLAQCSAGGWDFSINESLNSSECCLAQLESRSLSLQWQMTSPTQITHLLALLRSDETSCAVGTFHQLPVTFLRDDEYADRCFVLVGDSTAPCLRFTFAAHDFAALADVVQQAVDQLSDL